MFFLPVVTLIKQNKVSHGRKKRLLLEAGSKLVSEKTFSFGVNWFDLLSFQIC